MFMRTTILSFLSLTVLLLSGCLNLEPKPDTTKLYTLGLQHEAKAKYGKAERSVYIARPELPGYLISNRLVYHTDARVLASFPDARWAEDLSDGIARALGEYLQATGTVDVRAQYPWPKVSARDWEVRLLFKKFEATEEGAVQISALWEVRDGGKVKKEGYFQSEGLSCDLADAGSFVRALNEGMSQLAAAIAASL